MKTTSKRLGQVLSSLRRARTQFEKALTHKNALRVAARSEMWLEEAELRAFIGKICRRLRAVIDDERDEQRPRRRAA